MIAVRARALGVCLVAGAALTLAGCGATPSRVESVEGAQTARPAEKLSSDPLEHLYKSRSFQHPEKGAFDVIEIGKQAEIPLLKGRFDQRL